MPAPSRRALLHTRFCAGSPTAGTRSASALATGSATSTIAPRAAFVHRRHRRDPGYGSPGVGSDSHAPGWRACVSGCPASELSGSCTGTLTLKTAKRMKIGTRRRIATLGRKGFALRSGRSAAIYPKALEAGTPPGGAAREHPGFVPRSARVIALAMQPPRARRPCFRRLGASRRRPKMSLDEAQAPVPHEHPAPDGSATARGRSRPQLRPVRLGRQERMPTQPTVFPCRRAEWRPSSSVIAAWMSPPEDPQLRPALLSFKDRRLPLPWQILERVSVEQRLVELPTLDFAHLGQRRGNRQPSRPGG